MRKFLLPLSLALLALMATAVDAGTRHVSAELEEFAQSGVRGRVEVTQVPRGGTLVTLKADGLRPGTMYVSEIHSNQVCDREPFEESRVIGRFASNSVGMATITRKMPASLAAIGSVSIREITDGDLQACANLR